MFGLRAEYDTIEDLRLSRITQNDSTHNIKTSTSSSTTTTDTITAAFSVKHVDDEPYDAFMLTLRIGSEEKSGGVDEGLRRYNDMLATLGYASGHREDSAVGDGTAYYNARAEIITTGIDTNATAFEPTGRGDNHAEGGDDNEEDTIMLVAHHEDRRISLIVDSGTQSYNQQDLEASGLERSNTSKAGFIASPRPERPDPPGLSSTEEASDTTSNTSDHSRRRRRMGSLSPPRTWRTLDDSRTISSPSACLADAACPPNWEQIRVCARAAPRSRSTRGTGCTTPACSTQKHTPSHQSIRPRAVTRAHHDRTTARTASHKRNTTRGSTKGAAATTNNHERAQQL